MTVTVDALDVSAYTVPTDEPEADGTFSWTATTFVVAEPLAGDCRGLGFSYTTSAAAVVIDELLRDVVVGSNATDVRNVWRRMVAAIRNVGRPGVASAAIAAVDIALWDLQAKLLGRALVDVLGAARDSAPIYGSGGFTSYSDDELRAQLGSWVHDERTPRVKMKIGTDRTLERVRVARAAIGDDAELYVDANGAFTAKQAVRLCEGLDDAGVIWFEEPVSSDDLSGLRTVREQTDIDVAAGEYGSDLPYFERMCAAGAVDVLQADVTRCAGITEWLRVAACAAAHGLEISGHCAPALHLHPACAAANLRHLEHFHDHVRIEHLLFDGVVDPVEGALVPDRSRPGLGLELKRTDAERYRIR
jgi:L-alanine-DL-glutamate epimerase-like enolase superfamily enzyme